MLRLRFPIADYLYVGDILTPHGLKGALTVYSYTHPHAAIKDYLQWRVGFSVSTAHEYTVHRCWQHGKSVLVQLDGIQSREDAEALKGQKIWIDRQEVRLDNEDYLWEDLVGCMVQSNTEILGKVTALQDFGAQEILVIQTLSDAKVQGEWMLPFVHDVVLDVDMDERLITVSLLEGLDVCFTPKF